MNKKQNANSNKRRTAVPSTVRRQGKAASRQVAPKVSRAERRGPEGKSKARRPYPRATIEQALKVPAALKENNGGNPWPPADVAKALGLSQKNTDFFYLAAASRDFGFTDGSRDSDQITLTEFGRDVVYAPSKSVEIAKLRDAMLKIDIFKKVLDYYKGASLPEMQYLGNTLVREFGLATDYHEEFSRIFQENCKFLGIGAGFSSNGSDGRSQSADSSFAPAGTVVMAEPAGSDGLKCFVAMPFSERETHPTGFFDEVLRSLIVPAGRDAGFEIVTANREGSDVIQATIVNQLLDADLVIADLTENNPNVLFELGLRIAEDKPVALIRATGTRAIFDVDNMLRVYEYDSNLWSSTIVHDRLRLTEHIKAAWAGRGSDLTFIKILRERRAVSAAAG